jgi:MOSC domain-containing protein YiiM
MLRMTDGRLVSINVSDGGVPKLGRSACAITRAGLAGDRQRDLVHHGGPDRAVTLFSCERIDALRREGHPIAAGTIGENLTVSGLDWPALTPGMRLRVGAVLLELTRHASPCAKIGPSFAGQDFMRVAQKVHPGWSRLCARVIEEGVVRVGDPVAILVAAAGGSG